MLKVLPIISKKFLVVLMGVLLVASMIFFVSPGKIYGSTTNYYVDPTGTDDGSHGTATGASAFKTIQYAINDARVLAGDTINVAAGTYAENVMVDKSVTLISDTGDYRTTGTILTGSGNFFTLEDGVNDITIQGFRFENIAVASNSIIWSPGVSVQQNNITIQSNSFINIAGGPAVGLYGGLPQVRNDWLITDNKIDNLTGTNISGLWISQLSNSTISNNQFSKSTYAGMILEYLQNVVISGNTISNTPRRGIQVANSPNSNVTITGNYITDTNKNNVADEGAITIYPNTTNIQVVSNTLTGNHQGFTVRNLPGGVGADVYVNSNNIYSNVGCGVGNFAQGGGILNATDNWWGSANPNFASITSGNVNHDPWYINAAMTTLSNYVAPAPIQVTGITVVGTGDATTVVNGETLAMLAAVLPADATDSSVTWSVATLVGGTATINAAGLLSATGVGTVTVTATAKDGSGITGVKVVTITEAPAPTSTPPAPLTAEDQVLLDLSISQQVSLYGASNTGFTKMLYDNILGRVTDAGGLDDWVTALDNGTMTPGEVVYNIVFSEELAPMISSFSDAEFITFLYQNVFNREPDSEGYDGWVTAMENGMSKEDVLLHFLDTDEFKSICEMFGLTQ